MNFRNLIPGLLTILFFSLCIYFAQKGKEGPWHATAMELWQKEEWQKLRALGENLNQVGKEDIEAFYVAMIASEQLQDEERAKFFASRISDSRVLNWRMEQRISRVYKPDSLRKSISLFRTRIVFGIATVLLIVMIFSLRRKTPVQIAPALLSSFGILILFL